MNRWRLPHAASQEVQEGPSCAGAACSRADSPQAPNCHALVERQFANRCALSTRRDQYAPNDGCPACSHSTHHSRLAATQLRRADALTAGRALRTSGRSGGSSPPIQRAPTACPTLLGKVISLLLTAQGPMGLA